MMPREGGADSLEQASGVSRTPLALLKECRQPSARLGARAARSSRVTEPSWACGLVKYLAHRVVGLEIAQSLARVVEMPGRRKRSNGPGISHAQSSRCCDSPRPQTDGSGYYCPSEVCKESRRMPSVPAGTDFHRLSRAALTDRGLIRSPSPAASLSCTNPSEGATLCLPCLVSLILTGTREDSAGEDLLNPPC